MFTRQHYKAIAEIVWNYLPMDNIAAPEVSIKEILAENKVVVEKLADYFVADNPRFNRDKFMKACGLE